MNYLKHTALIALLIALPAMAQSRKIRELDTPADFDKLEIGRLKDHVIYYSDNTQNDGKDMPAFDDWKAESPELAASLSLFKGYHEPTLTEKGVPVPSIYMFVARTKMIIDRPASSIDLKAMLTKVAEINSEFTVHTIPADQVINLAVAAKQPIANFAWCNTSATIPFGLSATPIARPMGETDLSNTTSPARPWCSDTSRSICIEACYIFDKVHQYEVATVNKLKSSDEIPTDRGMAFQAELRIPTSDEYGNLQNLTKVPSPIVSVIEQNTFYVNQAAQYMKAISVIQSLPSDPQKSVITALYVVAIKRKQFMNNREREVVTGKSALTYSGHGFLSGLPTFTQETISKIADLIENPGS
jgi:hypothetical protein